MFLKTLNIFEAEYSVIDFETSGLSAKKDRVIEAGVVKISGGKITDTFKTFVNPGIMIPAGITELTGITNDDLLTAPDFEEVAYDLLEFIGDSIIVAHNYLFDIKFLNEELKRIGYSPVSNPLLCTLRLSKKLFPELKSKSLGNVAQYLRIRHRDVHRALGDATVTAKIFLKQLEVLQRKLEIATVEELIAFAAINKTPDFFIMKKRLAKDFNKLSFNPGAYLFKNNKGEIIYIGKAKSLRNRIKSHFVAGSNSKSGEIIGFADSLEFIETNSELGALIVESALIKKHKPKYNVMLKKYSSAYFLKVEDVEKFGGVNLTRKINLDGNDYFGPYAGREIAGKILEIINVSFKLRECSEKEFKKGKACYLFDIQRCLAPCIYKDSETEYSKELEKVKLFLKGENREVIGNLTALMRRYSEEKKYEQAAEVRDLITFLLNQTKRIGTIKEAINRARVLVLIKNAQRKDYFALIDGRIIFKDKNLDGEDLFLTILRDYYNGTVSLFREVTKADVERLKITLSWMAKNNSKIVVFNLENYSNEKELFAKLSVF